MRAIVLATAICLSAVGLSSASDTQAAVRQSINIPAQDLCPALQTLAKEHNFQLVYRSEFVRDVRTAGAVGELTSEEALTRLLQGTGLSHRRLDDKTMTIAPLPTSEKGRDESSSRSLQGGGTEERAEGRNSEGQEKGNTFWARFRLAQADQGQASNDRSVERSDTAPERKSARIEEVIVTATKRGEERVQDIPMSIAVISNQDIERRGLIGMEDYLRSIPGVNQIDRGGADNAIVIRGITTSPQFENFSSGATVGSYFDETPITGAGGVVAGGIDVRPVDLERIEVLRGPQGTAYGSASLSGTLRMIPAKPQLDGFSAKLAASYSNTSGFGSENWMGQGVVNIPVVKDKFALRAVAYRYDESGFYRNIAGIDPELIAIAENFGLGDFVRGHVQDDVGRMVSTGGRVAALWQATDKLDLSLNFLTQKIEQDGTPLATVGKFEQSFPPIAPQGRLRGEVGEVVDNEIDLVNLVLNYDFGWAALTSAASWVDSGSPFATSLLVFAPASNTAESDFKSFTAEVRMASQLEGRFQFLGGLFYEDAEVDRPYTIDWPGTPATNPFGTNPIFQSEISRNLDQRAIFGEVSYDLTEKLTATLGGRYFKYEKDERILSEGGLVGVPIGAGIAQILEGGESDSSFKAALSYKPTQDSLVYASWAEGFRLGQAAEGLPSAVCDTDGDGLVDGTSISIESTRRINSDFLESYEIGGKFTLFDRRIVVDAAVYHTEWDGLPIFTVAPRPPSGCGIGYTANVGAAASTGVEFQASLFVVEGLRLDFGAGYTNAELSEDAPGLGAEEGTRLPGSPEVSANLAAQYDFGIAGHKAFVRADSFYTGKFYGDLQETPDFRAGDYIKVDARAGVVIKNFSVELFVRNLTDEDAFTWLLSFSGAGYRLQPRTVGVQLGYNF